MTVKKSVFKSKSTAKYSLMQNENDVYDDVNRTVDYYKPPKKNRNNSVQSMESIGTTRKLGDRVAPIKALEIGKSKMTEQIRLYDPADYEWEAQKYISWIK